MTQEADDSLLIEQARAGDTIAFEALIRAHREPVYRAIFHVLKDEDASMDILQDACLKAWQNLDGFEQRSSFRTWLRRIAVNLALNHRRDHRHERAWASLDQEAAPSPSDPKSISPSERFESDELRALVQREINALPELHAIALRLFEIEGLTYAEIAELLDVPAGTVMSRVFHARQKLRDRLREHPDFQEGRP